MFYMIYVSKHFKKYTDPEWYLPMANIVNVISYTNDFKFNFLKH